MISDRSAKLMNLVSAGPSIRAVSSVKLAPAPSGVLRIIASTAAGYMA